MKQHVYYTKYALQFADMQIPELVNEFNAYKDSDLFSLYSMISLFKARFYVFLRFGHELKC